MADMIAFVRGIANFENRRIPKREQENLLQRYLPQTIRFVGAFDKSGNYALSSPEETRVVAAAITTALRKHEKLRSLKETEIAVILAESLMNAFRSFIKLLMGEYGEKFNVSSFGVKLQDQQWRAGLSILPEPLPVESLDWPDEAASKLKVLGASGCIVFFLKREEKPGQEHRIPLGVPTKAVEDAFRHYSGRPTTSTSRTLRTVRGVLRYFYQTEPLL
jgi:hypothetical protein